MEKITDLSQMTDKRYQIIKNITTFSSSSYKMEISVFSIKKIEK
jgi:hypothetical protein